MLVMHHLLLNGLQIICRSIFWNWCIWTISSWRFHSRINCVICLLCISGYVCSHIEACVQYDDLSMSSLEVPSIGPRNSLDSISLRLWWPLYGWLMQIYDYTLFSFDYEDNLFFQVQFLCLSSSSQWASIHLNGHQLNGYKTFILSPPSLGSHSLW